MRNPVYLAKSRHGIFYFRYPLHRGATLKLSLRTRSPALALRLTRALSVIALDEVSKLANGHIGLDELRATIAKHFESYRARHREQVEEAGPRREVELETFEKFLDLADTGRLREGWNDVAFEEYVAEKQLPLKRGTALYAELQDEHAHQSIDYRRYIVQYDRAIRLGDGAITPIEKSLRNVVNSGATVTVKALAQEFRVFKTKQGLWKEQTAKARDAYLDVLLELLGGDRPADSVTVDDARRVRDSLLNLPSNRSKKLLTRELAVSEQLEVQATALAMRTTKAHIQAYSALFQWATDEKRIPVNPFVGITVTVSVKNLRGSERLPFSEDQLGRVLAAVVSRTTSKGVMPYRYWGPLIGMFSGARLNEICQLTASDIRQVGSVWCIDVNDEGDGKSIKTMSAKRLVPIHSFLLHSGLLEFAEAARLQPGGRLFSELTFDEKNGWGRSLSRWFNETLLVELGIKTKQLTFHSLRHTMVHRLVNAGVEEAIVKQIVGHRAEGVTQAVYNALGYSVARKQEAIERFSLPRQADAIADGFLHGAVRLDTDV